MENLREVLQDLVAESGLSLRALAHVSGVTATQYSRYLHDGIPTLPVILKIAVYFNCSLDYLFGLDEQRNRGHYHTTRYDISGLVERYQTLLAQNHTNNRAFADAQGFHRTMVTHWRRGKEPRLDVLYVIAKHLHGSIDELVGRE